MEWLTQLFTTNGVAHTIIIYSVVIALGVYLGKIKFFGIALGSTFVLFLGLLAGHLGLQVDANTLKFAQEFGLILFIFSIGLQVGPGFFSSLKQGGLRFNGLAVLVVVLNVAVALGIYFISGDISITDLVGVMSGAVTNTPGLGAAQQTLSEMGLADASQLSKSMSMGYAAAYPLGVVGIILSAVLLKAIFKINLEKESAQIEEEVNRSQLQPHMVTYRVTNDLLNGVTVQRMAAIIQRNYVISRIKRAATGEVIIPKSDTLVLPGDLLLVVTSPVNQEAFDLMVGEKVEMKWEMDKAEVVSRRILVTNADFQGRKIGSLHLRQVFGLNATRVNRAGVDLVARANLALQVGDRITVVGHEADINHLAEKLGNSMRRLHQPNLFAIFLGIFFGIILGSVPVMLPGMSVPMKLGLAGGPLIVAILLGAYGYKLKIVTYTSSSANLMLRELGICLFLASVGLAAGGDFVATVFTPAGARWVLYGFIITFVPLVVVTVLARAKYRMNYCSIMGLMAGSTTDPPMLEYANKTAGNDAPAVTYATVYPLTMFMRVLVAEIIIITLV